jgi:hypothetical protein
VAGSWRFSSPLQGRLGPSPVVGSRAEEGCFSGLFRALPVIPFAVGADAKQLSLGPSWVQGCGKEGMGGQHRRQFAFYP